MVPRKMLGPDRSLRFSLLWAMPLSEASKKTPLHSTCFSLTFIIIVILKTMYTSTGNGVEGDVVCHAVVCTRGSITLRSDRRTRPRQDLSVSWGKRKNGKNREKASFVDEKRTQLEIQRWRRSSLEQKTEMRKGKRTSRVSLGDFSTKRRVFPGFDESIVQIFPNRRL